MLDPNNPRAFPSSAIDDAYGGMTLRDWFAGLALPSIIQSTSAGQHMPRMAAGETEIVHALARDAYAMADALMAERARRAGE